MNIDLLLTSTHEAGLVSDLNFDSQVAGILFDMQTRQMTLEFVNLETLEMNIPVEDDIADSLLWATTMQIGVIEKGQIQDNRQVPLMLLNDPDHASEYAMPASPSRSVLMFEQFMKACIAGQPLHREDLGNDTVSGSVMGGMNLSVLQLAPHLARQKTLEAAHNLNMEGPAGPAAPGMGMGGGGRVQQQSTRRHSSGSDQSSYNHKTDEDED